MKKILLIICLFPILVFSQKSYKIPADSTILNNIGSGKNELVIRNATSNITGGVLTNLGNGVTAFVLGGGSARVVDTIYKNNTKDSIVFTISGIRYAVKDSFNLNTDSQTLSISNNTLTISGGNTVDLNRKVDTSYSFRNTSLDSICQIVIINGNSTRSCIKDSTGGGGASLSGLTAATATNTINNANFGQEWQWNSLTSGTGLKLSSTSTGAASNTQSIFGVYQSGANATSGQTTYGAIFSNTHTGTSSTNIGGRFVASGATNNYAIEAESQARIVSSSSGTRYLSLWSSSKECARIGNLNVFGAGANDNLDLTNNCGMSIVFRTGSSGNGTERGRFRAGGAFCVNTTGQDGPGSMVIAKGSNNYAIYVEDAGSILLNGGTFKANVNTNFGVDGSDNMFFQVAGGAKMIIANTNGVSIGASTTPASSAILDVVSTTKGFLPPRMTTTQRDAISSPATGLTLFCTDCTATDASTGVMQTYNGATWKNFW